MSNISLTSVNLASVCVESFLYGSYVVFAVIFFFSYTRRGGGTAASRPLMFASVFMFLTITGLVQHWVASIARVFEAFVTHDQVTIHSAIFTNLAQPTEVVKAAMLFITGIIADITLVYRLSIVWNPKLPVIIFPICTTIGFTVCGLGLTYQVAQYDASDINFTRRLDQWVTGNFVFTLCTNVYSSGLIAWRIWKADRRLKSYSGSNNLLFIAIKVLECAALYAIWSIFFFVAYQAHSNIKYFACDIGAPIIGVTFLLVSPTIWQRRPDMHTSSVTSSLRVSEISIGFVVSDSHSVVESDAAQPEKPVVDPDIERGDK
ncbi:hypothetical protein BD779DRAFT_289493 [Infundibulicybe gibba]|nr:hypothetical protein BD779DRAFT_289493 [Infundibulicybe gibba]